MPRAQISSRQLANVNISFVTLLKHVTLSVTIIYNVALCWAFCGSNHSTIIMPLTGILSRTVSVAGIETLYLPECHVIQPLCYVYRFN